jgi:uncharacterized protein YejL (UPF0352 family)
MEITLPIITLLREQETVEITLVLVAAVQSNLVTQAIAEPQEQVDLELLLFVTH